MAELHAIDGDPEDADYPEPIRVGLVPNEWPRTRLLGTATHDGGFVDLGHPDSLAHLRSALADRVLHYGLDDLDAGAIRRAPRPFTQEISRYVFENARDDDAQPISGVCYRSRLGDEFGNWAVFEPSAPTNAEGHEIDPGDDALLAVFERFDLSWG